MPQAEAQGPLSLSLPAQKPLGAQPQPSWGSCSCELPVTTYRPTASTHMR